MKLNDDYKKLIPSIAGKQPDDLDSQGQLAYCRYPRYAAGYTVACV